MSLHKISIAVFGNPLQKDKKSKFEILFRALLQLPITVYVEERFYAFLRHEIAVDVHWAEMFSLQQLPKVDFAISVGGDGTFLQTTAIVAPLQIPLFGVNLGRLGFLSNINIEDLAQCIAHLHKGEYVVEKRSLISVTSSNESLTIPQYALNEVAVLKHDNSSTIRVFTQINEQTLSPYTADGLMLSTPSGSTGYALSVGGPIVEPEVNAFILSPVAPHSLTARPLVLNDSQTIRLRVESRNHNYLLAIDGKSQSLAQTTQLILKKASFYLHFVKFPHNSFLQTLREKLMWGVDQRS